MLLDSRRLYSRGKLESREMITRVLSQVGFGKLYGDGLTPCEINAPPAAAQTAVRGADIPRDSAKPKPFAKIMTAPPIV